MVVDNQSHLQASTVYRTTLTKMTPTKFKILTHNVQGLNSPTKRTKAFHYHHKMGIDVLLLQETHFSWPLFSNYLNAKYPTYYLSNGLDKKRGVAVCLSKRVPFASKGVIQDKEGRYILVNGKINEHEVTFISYYTPSAGQTPFSQNMLNMLMPHVTGHIIFGGDSNTSLDQILDKSNSLKTVLKHTPKQSTKLARLLHSHGLIDVRRDNHPTMRDYTHYSHVHKT